MKYIGALILLTAGYLIGNTVVKDIRRFVVDSRKGDAHASGMVMTYTFTGIILSVIVMILVSWLFQCSQMWYFPTFTIAFLINMRRQYKEENGSMEMPPVNQEFLDHFKQDMQQNAKQREEAKKKH